MDAFYERRVTSPEPQKIYFVLTAEKCKKRYYNHKKSFSHKRYSHEMTLSSYVWYLEESLDTAPNLQMVSSEVCHTLLKHLSLNSVFSACTKNWLLLPFQDNANF